MKIKKQDTPDQSEEDKKIDELNKQIKELREKGDKTYNIKIDNKSEIIETLEAEVIQLKEKIAKQEAEAEETKVTLLKQKLLDAGYDEKNMEGYSSTDLEKVIALLSTKDGKIRIPRKKEEEEETRKEPVIEMWNPDKRLVEDWNKRFESQK
jgi:hypothetical protein